MTLMLELTQEEEKRLRERAAQQGQDALAYALGLVRQGLGVEAPVSAPKHSVMDFYGIGRQTWQGVDVQQYIREMRDEWDRDDATD